MATALKLKNDIKKLKAAIGSKATPKSFVPKLKAQLDKAENELASMKKSGRPRKTSTTKGTEKTLTALQKLIQKKKYGVYQGAGVDLKKDAGEGAFATGRRVSKGLKSNQWGDASENRGNVYYEYRPNRLDVKQPKKKQSYPKLEKGGYMADGGETVKYYGKEFKNTFDINDKQFKEAIDSFYDTGSDDNYERVSARLNISKLRRELGEEKSKEVFEYIKSKFASGGMMAKGGQISGTFKFIVYKTEGNNFVSTQLKGVSPNNVMIKGVEGKLKGNDYNSAENVAYVILDEHDYIDRVEIVKVGASVLKNKKVAAISRDKDDKNRFSVDYYAKGGGIYSSDSLYILTISKDGNMIGHEPFRAKNMSEAREMAEDMEEKYTSKFGSDLEFSIKEAMADGGQTDMLKEDDYVWNALGKKLIVDKVTDNEYYLSGFMQKGASPWSKVKIHEYIKNGEWSLKPKMAEGGELKVGDKVIFKDNKYRVSKITNENVGGFIDTKWHLDSTKIGVKDVVLDSPKGVTKISDSEYMANSGYMADGGEVGKGFYIREMKEKLNKMFPDSFGFTVGNFSKEGDLFKNSSALIVDTNSPFNGLQDSEIKSNLFFPQYKRDHDIRFRIYQGGENTYFYFLLESENGDQYIGQFGFKDEGDVSADYITRFIAFLMEQYGLPFEVKHSVMAKGGYMAGGGEMHKADYFKDGGKVFSEKELKEILDEALGHFYQGLNQIDLAMRYLEVKGQGGLKTPLSNKLKLDDLRESVEKIDEYISK